MDFYKQKFSTLSLEYCKQYLRIDEDFTDDDDYISLCLEAGKSFIVQYSEKRVEELDEIPYTSIVLLKVIAEMYTNKTVSSTTGTKTDDFTKMLLSKIRGYTV